MASRPSSATGGVAPAKETRVRDPIFQLAVGWGIRWFGLSAYAPYLLIFFNADLHLPYLEAGLLVALPNTTGLIFPLLGGGVADRFGRRRLIVTTFAFESVGLAVMSAGALLPSIPIVLAGLVGSRASATLGAPAVGAYVTDFTDRARRAEAQSWLRTALNAGFTGGTLAGGLALGFTSFGQLALITAAITAVGVVTTALLIPKTPYDQQLETAKTITAGVQAQGPPPARGPVNALLSSLVALRTNRVLLLLWAAACATWTLNQQIGYGVPAFAHSGLGVSYAIVGAALAFNTVLVVFLQVPLTRFLRGRRMTLIGVTGTLLYVAAFLGLGLASSLTVDVELALFGVVGVITLGECLIFYPVSTLSMNLADEKSRGAFAGVMNMSVGTSTILAPLLAGLAFGTVSSPLGAWTLLALPAIPGVWLLLAVRRRVPSEMDRC